MECKMLILFLIYPIYYTQTRAADILKKDGIIDNPTIKCFYVKYEERK